MKTKAQLYQYSLMHGLLEGLYDGDKTMSEIAAHGDFGLGTFNGMDGEMVAYNGEFFQLKSDGTSHKVNMNLKTPFASVTHFQPDITQQIIEPINKNGLDNWMKKLTPGPNLMYAIHLKGHFAKVKTRTVSIQQKPYKPFTEIVQGQAEFDFEHKDGLLVGFYAPQYMQGITVAGYHLHFITNQRNGGGHTLDFVMDSGILEIQILNNYKIELPNNTLFSNADFSGDKDEAIKSTEGSN